MFHAHHSFQQSSIDSESSRLTFDEDMASQRHYTPHSTTQRESPEIATPQSFLVYLTKTQFGRLLDPVYNDVAAKFLQQLGSGHITLDYARRVVSSQSMQLAYSNRSPWHVMSNTSKVLYASSQALPTRFDGSGSEVCYLATQAHDIVIGDPNTQTSPTSHRTSHFRQSNSQLLGVGYHSPSSQPNMSQSSDQCSNEFQFGDLLNLPEVEKKSAGTPRSTYHGSSSSRHGVADCTSDITTSPEVPRKLSISSSQPSDLSKSCPKWIFKDSTKATSDQRKEKTVKTPCPKCSSKEYEIPAEFVKHMIAVHEKPIEYKCNHHRKGRHGQLYYCKESQWNFSAWKKHHSQQHSDICQLKQTQVVALPGCRRDVPIKHRVYYRGCWLCSHLSFTVEQWVEHHLGFHRGCSRRLMTPTWAIKSLLLNPKLLIHWEIQLNQLQVNTGHFWEISWSHDPEDSELSGLITSLETGVFCGQYFREDPAVAEQVTLAAFKAASQTSRRLDKIPVQGLQDIQRNLQHLLTLRTSPRQFVASADSQARQLKRNASSSPPAEYSGNDQVEPWLQTQYELGDMKFDMSQTDSNEASFAQSDNTGHLF